MADLPGTMHGARPPTNPFIVPTAHDYHKAEVRIVGWYLQETLIYRNLRLRGAPMYCYDPWLIVKSH